MTQDEVIGRVIDSLVELAIPYTVAGSFASNRHGVPRMTQDADIVIDVDEPLVLELVRRLGAEFYVSDTATREAVGIHSARAALRVDRECRSRRPPHLEPDLPSYRLLQRAHRPRATRSDR